MDKSEQAAEIDRLNRLLDLREKENRATQRRYSLLHAAAQALVNKLAGGVTPYTRERNNLRDMLAS